MGRCKSQTSLVGKTTIITGANKGIGYETALDFAKRGAKVILACRDQQRAEEARDRIIENTGNENIVVKLIDMASFKSVRAFAKDINATEERLDILVNNAGVSTFHNVKSEDGHVLLMQINYFSSFLLTNLLIDLMKKSKPSRIVNLSSIFASFARNFDLNNIDVSKSKRATYSASKLCNLLFTIELSRKIQGTGITTYSLHPGLVKTDIFNNVAGFMEVPFKCYVNIFFKTPEEGAQTTIYCSVAKGIEEYNGSHFADCQVVPPYRSARDPTLPKKLWELSEKIVELKPEEIQY